jgi:hypothetical protein
VQALLALQLQLVRALVSRLLLAFLSHTYLHFVFVCRYLRVLSLVYAVFVAVHVYVVVSLYVV